MPQNRQFLERHGNQYRVVLGVPLDVQSKLGTKLKRSLKTDSLTLANQMKWSVIAELKRIIKDAHEGKPVGERIAARNSPSRGGEQSTSASELEFDQAVTRRVVELFGVRVTAPRTAASEAPSPVIRAAVTTTPPILRPQVIAPGSGAVPIIHHYEEYFRRLETVDRLHIRTRDDDQRAIDTFERWRVKCRIGDDLALVTTKVAKAFAQQLPTFEKVRSPVTCKKYIVRLRQYWGHMAYQESVEFNPFLSVVIKTPKSLPEESERPFTDDEVRRLLIGDCSQHLKDLMMIGALTGARLDAIVELRVRHTVGGCLTMKRQKKEAGPRDVPMHSALAEIIERRTTGRAPDDWLFPEYPPPKKVDSLKEHSSQATKVFTDYRRVVGVDEVVPGKRRSLVNFHSFRRWFVTKAERAGQSPELIAAIVGHKRAGLTLGLYSGGPEMEQARQCVEAVILPPLTHEFVPEAHSVLRRSTII